MDGRNQQGYGYSYGSGSQQGYQGYPQPDGYPPTSGYPPTAGPNHGYQQGSYGQEPPANQGFPYHQGHMYNQGPPQAPAQNQGNYSHEQTYPGGPPQPYHGPQQPQDQFRGPGISSWGPAPPTSYNSPPPQQNLQQSNPLKQPKPAKTDKTSDSSKGLSSRFSGLMHRKSKDKSDSSGSDSDSDSDSSRDKKSKKDKKKKKKSKPKYATPPIHDPRDGPFPFSAFCARDNPNSIILEIVDAGEGHDLLVGFKQDNKHPAYKIEYDDNLGFKAYRCDLPDLDPDEAKWAGTYKWDQDDPQRCCYKFPWGKWDTDVFAEFWWSDVGLLEGKCEMNWALLNNSNTYSSGKFVARCFDMTTSSAPTVASFYMNDFDFGKLEIPAQLVRTVEQLDELVVVATATMCNLRWYVRENPDNMAESFTRKELE